MKTLANCSPAEFMKQGYLVAKKAGELFEKSQVLEIRKNMPTLSGKETVEEKQELMRKQSKKNISEMLQVLMCEYPDDTVELLGLLCFIPKEEIDNHSGFELFTAGIEVLNSKEVLDFLSSLMKLGQK